VKSEFAVFIRFVVAAKRCRQIFGAPCERPQARGGIRYSRRFKTAAGGFARHRNDEDAAFGQSVRAFQRQEICIERA